ncbi:MAG: phosphate ABC transporter substrate-binding protein, partial [Leadbetterella sp.]|nr:phosphate ABC transporter substrate-binding protein [Leadbetterella sp.]
VLFHEKLTLSLLVLCTILSCSKTNDKSGEKNEGPSATLKLSGSTTVSPFIQAAAPGFSNENPGVEIVVSEGGSGVGIANLIDGTTDIAMSSRDIKESEKIKLEEKGTSLTEVKVADDALAIIINPVNPVKELTREQLELIFTGQVSNWKELGGNDSKIIPISRETSSGTYDFFKEVVLNKKEFGKSTQFQGASGGVVQQVSTTEGSIGYVGLAFISDRVKALPVSFENSTFVTPSLENVKNKTYPVARPLFLYYTDTANKYSKSLVEFLLSDKGQEIAETSGYVSVK